MDSSSCELLLLNATFFVLRTCSHCRPQTSDVTPPSLSVCFLLVILSSQSHTRMMPQKSKVGTVWSALKRRLHDNGWNLGISCSLETKSWRKEKHYLYLFTEDVWRIAVSCWTTTCCFIVHLIPHTSSTVVSMLCMDHDYLRVQHHWWCYTCGWVSAVPPRAALATDPASLILSRVNCTW